MLAITVNWSLRCWPYQVRKQNAAIHDVISQIHDVQHDINSVGEKLARTEKVTDKRMFEVCFFSCLVGGDVCTPPSSTRIPSFQLTPMPFFQLTRMPFFRLTRVRIRLLVNRTLSNSYPSDGARHLSLHCRSRRDRRTGPMLTRTGTSKQFEMPL